MKKKTVIVAVLLGLGVFIGCAGTTIAADAGDSVYDWGPWGKMVSPAAGQNVTGLAAGGVPQEGVRGFSYNPPKPAPPPAPPAATLPAPPPAAPGVGAPGNPGLGLPGRPGIGAPLGS